MIDVYYALFFARAAWVSAIVLFFAKYYIPWLDIATTYGKLQTHELHGVIPTTTKFVFTSAYMLGIQCANI